MHRSGSVVRGGARRQASAELTHAQRCAADTAVASASLDSPRPSPAVVAVAAGAAKRKHPTSMLRGAATDDSAETTVASTEACCGELRQLRLDPSSGPAAAAVRGCITVPDRAALLSGCTDESKDSAAGTGTRSGACKGGVPSTTIAKSKPSFRWHPVPRGWALVHVPEMVPKRALGVVLSGLTNVAFLPAHVACPDVVGEAIERWDINELIVQVCGPADAAAASADPPIWSPFPSKACVKPVLVDDDDRGKLVVEIPNFGVEGFVFGAVYSVQLYPTVRQVGMPPGPLAQYEVQPVLCEDPILASTLPHVAWAAPPSATPLAVAEPTTSEP